MEESLKGENPYSTEQLFSYRTQADDGELGGKILLCDKCKKICHLSLDVEVKFLRKEIYVHLVVIKRDLH